MASIDLGRRIVQLIWDPVPTNDASLDVPVWCLGRSYTLQEGDRMDKDSRESNITGDSKHEHDVPHEEYHIPRQQAVNTDAAACHHGTSSPPQGESLKVGYPTPLPENMSFREDGWPSAFVEDFGSRIWMTYRSDFEPIPKSSDPKAYSTLSLSMRIKSQLMDAHGFTSDSGWGCMIRSGQSLLANTLAIQQLGRNWRRGTAQLQERELLSLFADDPSAPYSIHSFVRHGAEYCGKYPGQWFGPSATASCIRALTEQHNSPLRVYSTGDRPEIHEADFLKVSRRDGESIMPTLILVGTRLGTENITQAYWNGLTQALQMPQSVGIAGGRPSSSHYFVGTQGPYFFYLDPHYTRQALPYRAEVADYTDDEMATCYTTRLRRIHIKEMDPSMLIGFLIRDDCDWEDWKRRLDGSPGRTIVEISGPSSHHGGPPAERASAIDEVESLTDSDEESR